MKSKNVILNVRANANDSIYQINKFINFVTTYKSLLDDEDSEYNAFLECGIKLMKIRNQLDEIETILEENLE